MARTNHRTVLVMKIGGHHGLSSVAATDINVTDGIARATARCCLLPKTSVRLLLPQWVKIPTLTVDFAIMRVRELSVPNAYEFIPQVFPDERGLFVAPFQELAFRETVGHSFQVAQTNHSLSRRGVIRGIHFTEIPPGQGKYVYCPSGRLLDIVVDIRVGSPTYGQWDAVLLDAQEYRAVYLAEGLGHAFVALTDNTVISYLCSTGYQPNHEHGINPLDPLLRLPWEEYLGNTLPILSTKDEKAPSFSEAEEAGLLPQYQACQDFYQTRSKKTAAQ